MSILILQLQYNDEKKLSHTIKCLLVANVIEFEENEKQAVTLVVEADMSPIQNKVCFE